MASAKNEPRNPRVVLEADHEAINALLERLLAAMRAEDRIMSLTLWARVEKWILTHLDVEEMLVFPLLQKCNSDEVTALRHQHDQLRGTLGKLGLGFELRVLPVARVVDFMASLRAHEEREESLLYRQAESGIPVNAARSIFTHLSQNV